MQKLILHLVGFYGIFTYRILVTTLVLSWCSSLHAQDKTTVLDSVMINARNTKSYINSGTPVQSLDKQRLNQIEAYSVGDAAKYFSGALIKDYGGIGGLKTISVRSLGGAHTGIVYDGVPVSDVQSGQIDLSRFSTSFIESIDLYQAGITELTIPARAAAAGATLAMETNTFDQDNIQAKRTNAGMRFGSFQQTQAFASTYIPLQKKLAVSATAEGLYSNGSYPVRIINGNQESKSQRQNSQVRSIQGEINFVAILKDSSSWQTKIGAYKSGRGLPGPVIFFNERSVQRLYNEDLYAQSRVKKHYGSTTTLVVLFKYQRSATRYRDPDFFNNAGGLDNRYQQQEAYSSIAFSQRITRRLSIGAASDLAYTALSSNTSNYVQPSRWSLWNHLSARYRDKQWQGMLSLLYTHLTDKTGKPERSDSRNIFTPAFSLSFRPSEISPVNVRAFYKRIFRVPTFNDLYYTLLINSSLRPELAEHFNLGISYTRSLTGKFRTLSLSMDAYQVNVKDKIVAAPGRNLFVWTMLNVGKVRVRGIDGSLESSGILNSHVSWYLRTAYTYQRAIDITQPGSPEFRNTIPYTPDHSGSLLVSFGWKSWRSGYNGLASGSRYAPGGNNSANKIPSWSTHDFFVSRKFLLRNYDINLKATIVNASDSRYDVVRFYPMPGRSFLVGVQFNNL